MGGDYTEAFYGKRTAGWNGRQMCANAIFGYSFSIAMRISGTTIRYVVVGLLLLALLTANIFLAPLLAPVREGNAIAFWDYCCAVHLGDEWHYIGGCVLPRDGYFVYYQVSMDGPATIYRVSGSEIKKTMPQVIARLEEMIQNGEASKVILDGYDNWHQQWPSTKDDPEALVKAMHESFLASRPAGAIGYWTAQETEIAETWRRAQWYWLNVVLESVYLSAILLFAAWPWLRRKGVWSWAMHFSLVPLLILLPSFLGYVQWSPSGGPLGGSSYSLLVYTMTECHMACNWTNWDTEIVKGFPAILHPISQCWLTVPPAPDDRALGPIAGVLMGLGNGTMVLLVGLVARRTVRKGRAKEPTVVR